MPSLKRAIVIVALVCVVIVGATVALSFGELGAGAAVGVGAAIIAVVVVAFILALVVVRKLVGTNADLLGQAGTIGASRHGSAGLPGTATILSVRDTGMTLNHINAVMELGLRVSADGQPPYDTMARVALARHSWGSLQPGMAVAVRIDPKNRKRVAVDLSANAGAAGGRAMEGTVQTPGGTFDVPGMAGAARADGVVSTADILAGGVRGEAEIRSLGHTGATAAQMVPGADLRPEEADDPMVHVAMTVMPPGGPAFETQAVMRVPDGKLPLLAMGKRVPVAWLAESPDTVTIDWAALR